MSLKIEGRQRSPAYVEQVTKVWRQAIDTYLKQPDKFQTQAHWEQALAKVSEGQITTLGAYERDWQYSSDNHKEETIMKISLGPLLYCWENSRSSTLPASGQ